ncbi:hypothetical protein, partial [Halorhodospira sp. 9622]|uniref:hypothetical protein n=1 Tax=Halorhodospira sp. 9622 TaxID=2899136 RepID=UPI001EE86FB9
SDSSFNWDLGTTAADAIADDFDGEVIWSLSVDQVTNGVGAGALQGASDVNVEDSYESLAADGFIQEQANTFTGADVPDTLFEPTFTGAGSVNDVIPVADFHSVTVTTQWDADDQDEVGFDGEVDLLILQGGTDGALTVGSDVDAVRIEDDAEVHTDGTGATQDLYLGDQLELTLEDDTSQEQVVGIGESAFGSVVNEFEDGTANAEDTVALDYDFDGGWDDSASFTETTADDVDFDSIDGAGGTWDGETLILNAGFDDGDDLMESLNDDASNLDDIGTGNELLVAWMEDGGDANLGILQVEEDNGNYEFASYEQVVELVGVDLDDGDFDHDNLAAY